MRTVTTTIDLDAPPDEIWHVLTDTAAHSDWNPFITELHGDLAVGNRIDVRIAPPGGKPMSFHPTVTDVEPGRKLVHPGAAARWQDGAGTERDLPRPVGGTVRPPAAQHRGRVHGHA